VKTTLINWYSEASEILQKEALNRSSVFVSLWMLESSESQDPAMAMASAALAFLETQWRRVAPITHISQHLCLHTAEHFYKSFNSKIDSHSFRISNFPSTSDILKF